MLSRLLKTMLYISLILGLFSLVKRSEPAHGATTPPAPAYRQVIQVEYPTQEALELAAARLDLWEVHPEQRIFIAYASPEEIEWLQQAGYKVQIDTLKTHQILAPPGYPCYRTIEQLYADLHERVVLYPNLTRLDNIGSSYEGRDLWVMRLTSVKHSIEKPRFFLLANIHGREMITPETAMQFMDLLLENYGIDPDITWMLDWHEIYIYPSANPDGHVKNEALDEDQLFADWRKNTHPYGFCDPYSLGVDLNRNHSYQWGAGGSSTYECDLTYRGPSAASETETQALQGFVRNLFPDQRGSDETDAAPANATGILISLHSYSDLVLWPWGWTYSAAPNSADLAAIGLKLATFNGYTAKQASGLYPASGTTDDWSYGELGIASYTFEIGDDGFSPSCARYQDLIQPNLNALLYAARIARTPYLTARGPDIFNIQVTQTISSSRALVSAEVSDVQNGSQNIAAAALFLDAPPWAGGLPITLLPVDGAWDSPQESVQVDIDASNLSDSSYMLYLQGTDSAGNLGPVSAAWLVTQEEFYLPLIQKMP